MPDVRCACAKRVSARRALNRPGKSSALFRHPPPSQRGSGHQSTRSGSPDPCHLPPRVGARASQPSGALALLARRTAAISRFPVHPALLPFGRSCTPFGSGFLLGGVVPFLPVNAEGVEMSSFSARAASQPTSPGQRNGGTTPRRSAVPAHPTSSPPLAHSSLAHLTPACSGLATLAADARR